MKKYKCIIFDLDGTVLNTERMNLVPLQRLIKEELDKDVMYSDLLKYKAYAGKKTLEELGFKDIEKSYEKWVEYVNDFEEGATLFEGFDEVIKTLNSKGIICAIASSKMKDQYKIDFEPTGLKKYIKCEVLAEDTKRHKPYPDPLLKVTEILGISPNDCMYIGDTIFDFKATKAAGMDFGLAIWGADNLEGIEADFEFKKPIDILKELNLT
ncbi:HAD family hydrolase [Clostridium sp. DSM 100503]|uniref:HAD family hydrolase n=1 Tax=Clostridium sp. DSM 100503 TaxID=2963282 RepID=UPI00214A5765|nr:HAD family hydrolase [Clostridium sp. DSM 100503]MCR1950397.1 HAD family hydrolase [Clostridium sp. DSM 100503]